MLIRGTRITHSRTYTSPTGIASGLSFVRARNGTVPTQSLSLETVFEHYNKNQRMPLVAYQTKVWQPTGSEIVTVMQGGLNQLSPTR